MRKRRLHRLICLLVCLEITLLAGLAAKTSLLQDIPRFDSGFLVEAIVKGESLSWGVQRNSQHQTPTPDPYSVRCLEGKGFWIGPKDSKQVYLTFNCGWENGLTGRTLDLLREHQAPAAFFVTGDYAAKNPDLVMRMAAEGHQVGTHGETHRSFPQLSEAEMRRELALSSEKIGQLTGIKPRYFRPPSGSFNQRVLSLAYEMGYTTVFWSLSYPDWDTGQQPGRSWVFQRVMGDIHPGAVIQLHTVSTSNNEALGDIIKELRGQGYVLGRLNEISP